VHLQQTCALDRLQPLLDLPEQLAELLRPPSRLHVELLFLCASLSA
jgi:hypothetical protein